MSNKRIQVADLDFDRIRENLKIYFRGQEKFSDYDFEGSALSTIIDVLAYNTHYNALYTNLAVNEMFMDSASKRSSVVSIANNFGYTPRSCSASRAKFDLVVTQAGATDPVKYLQKFSPFEATVEGETYTFYTINDYIAERSATTYRFFGVEVYEGIPVNKVFLCTTENQRFNLSNENIDLSTLTVIVQENGDSADFEKYERVENVLDVNSESKVYYVKELDDGTYELYFGSNNLGKPIEVGNAITATYIVTNKAAANGASLFSYQGQTLGGPAVAVSVTNSFGGAEAESLDEIKRSVSQSFFDQNRAVTVADYSSIIKRSFVNAESINVWGGEDQVPPVYGKVFICVKPRNASFLTPSDKAFIKETLLRSRNVVSVIPEVVDPTFLELGMDVNVYYDPAKTIRSADDIRLAVINAINDYTTNNLKKFNGVFRMSKFSRAIDDCDVSIQSNISTFKLYYEVAPRFNTRSQYKFSIVNPVYRTGGSVPGEESFSSTGFYIDETDNVYYLDDNGIGDIRLFSIISESGQRVYRGNVGTIDYQTGSVDIRDLRITNLVDANLYFIFKTDSFDVLSVRNQIVDIPLNRLKVTAIQDQTSNSGLVSGLNYKFTSSRQ